MYFPCPSPIVAETHWKETDLLNQDQEGEHKHAFFQFLFSSLYTMIHSEILCTHAPMHYTRRRSIILSHNFKR